MATQVTRYNILLSSPGDVADERAAVNEVIEELNRTVCAEKDIVLSLIRWETHGFPDIGQDAQDVLNRQLTNDYDVFIGILWKRFGTPTGRAESGTTEEFEGARSKHQDDPASVHVMFYFKTKESLLALEEIDQYRKVLEFRKDLEKLGGLHWSFKEITEFKDLLRVHLSRLISTLGRSVEGSKVKSKKPTGAGMISRSEDAADHVSRSVIDEDAGMLDLADYGSKEFKEGTESVQRLTKYMEEMNASISESIARVDVVKGADVAIAQPIIRENVAAIASALNTFSMQMMAETPEMAGHFRNGLNAMSKAMAISVDFGENGRTQVRLLLDHVRTYRETVRSNAKTLRQVANSVTALPRLTGELNQAKRKFKEGVELYNKEMESIDRLLDELERLGTDLSQ